jgi:hypothetical protein
MARTIVGEHTFREGDMLLDVALILASKGHSKANGCTANCKEHQLTDAEKRDLIRIHTPTIEDVDGSEVTAKKYIIEGRKQRVSYFAKRSRKSLGAP